MSKRITTGHKLFYCNLEDKERNDDVMGGMRSLTMTKMTKYKELLKSTALEKSIFDNVCAGGGGVTPTVQRLARRSGEIVQRT